MYLELTDISKKIGADEVLSGITLSMERGKVYGLQGKNGCGKSMLMRVICGLVLPTVGEVKIDGKILGKEFSFPPSVGVFIEKPGFLDSYSGFQNLMMLASIKGQISGAEVKDVSGATGCNVQKISEIFSWNETETRDCSCNHGKTRTDYLR